MELTLLITGITAFVYAKVSKLMNKKKIFENKTVFSAWNASFALIAGILIIYILRKQQYKLVHKISQMDLKN